MLTGTTLRKDSMTRRAYFAQRAEVDADVAVARGNSGEAQEEQQPMLRRATVQSSTIPIVTSSAASRTQRNDAGGPDFTANSSSIPPQF